MLGRNSKLYYYVYDIRLIADHVTDLQLMKFSKCSHVTVL